MARRRSSSSSFSNLVLLALTLALFTGGLSWYRSSSNNLPASLSRVEEAHERIDALEEKVDALMRAGKGQGSNAASEQPKISEETSTDFGRVKRPKGVVTQPGIHAIVTSNGNRYMNWQTRVSYNSYMRQSRAPGSQFKAFTRLLHRATDDELMQEVPTVRIPSDHPDCDVWCSYPVADRGPALLRFLNMKIAWQYEHILVLETDHIFVAPLTIPLPQKGSGLAFPFGYIVPEWDSVKPIMRRYYSGPLKDIPGTGNSPVVLHVEDFARVVPLWVDTTEKIDADEEAVKVLGWVREMYAYSIASALANVTYSLPPVPKNPLMVQPPADEALGEAVICHYTWGTFIHEGDKELWRWDKREYASGQYGDKPVVPMVKIPPMPEYSPAFMTQDKQKFSKGKYDLVKLMNRHFNMAVDALNAVNGGLPLGFETLEEATAASKPGQEAIDAREKVVKAEEAKKAAEAAAKAS
ncbi:hypothetical protein CYMTET_33395 [Cymbomonas tetramitiformis]|uniref:Hydroxyproline O-arabinosyltransferase-like domain-containing protein n=1 Tax=Cymbomonas tetramitiformis TaxID=36881 RepID=A0AAE0FDB4_9CHLO|nr:hypothetical protein CYMTET_33395 [Cymbomonas tetramitiformis]